MQIHFDACILLEKKNGSWARKLYVPPSEVDVSSNNGSSEYDKNENQAVEARTSKNANVTPILSKEGVEAMADACHPSQIGWNEVEASDNLTAQISSLCTRLEEMALANDRYLTSLETHIDGFQEEFKAGMQVIWGQHDEMMAFLRGHFPLHGPDHIWPFLHFP